jgi:predicted nucleic acid-binding protein
VDARRRIETLSHLDVVGLEVDDLLAAIDLHRLHELSIWDALIVRAALLSGCRTLYTEDLQHGRRFEGLQVVNPFLDPELSPRT